MVIVCANFGRNIVIYRVGQRDELKPLLSRHHRDRSFWRQVNSNAIDIAVLEWCKLFGERDRNKPGYGYACHGWRIIVTDARAFEEGLYTNLNITEAEFVALVEGMRKLRDKFIAHLDSDRTMDIPLLTKAYEAVVYYHRHVVTVEREAHWDLGPPANPEEFSAAYYQLYADNLAMMTEALATIDG